MSSDTSLRQRWAQERDAMRDKVEDIRQRMRDTEHSQLEAVEVSGEITGNVRIICVIYRPVVLGDGLTAGDILELCQGLG